MIVRLFFNSHETACLDYDLKWTVAPTNEPLAKEIQARFDEVMHGSAELDGTPVEIGIDTIVRFLKANSVERWPAKN